MTLGTFSYFVLMQNEYRAAYFTGQRQRATELAESGITYLQALLALDDMLLDEQGGLIDNPNLMKGVLIVDDPTPGFRGRFTVLSPRMEQGRWSGSKYGLEDESTKLNLNTLLQQENRAENSPAQINVDRAQERLMALPGMNESIAAAILDWIDEDDVPRENGAEKADYMQLDPPYEPANGPLTHLDQLLAVRGVTPLLLYGLDTNRNYHVDADESSLTPLLDDDNEEGRLDRGWASYLTVTSAERVVNPEGNAKIDINSDNLQPLKSQLDKVITSEQATYIIAYRQYGPEASGPLPQGSAGTGSAGTGSAGTGSAGTGSAGTGSTGNISTGSTRASGTAGNGANNPAAQVVDASSVTIDYKIPGTHKFSSLFDLVGARVKIPAAKNAAPQIVESPWPDQPATFREAWLELTDQLSAGSATQLAGRININRAPQVVLETITQFSDSAIEQILSARDLDVIDDDADPHRDISWLVAESIVSLAEIKQIAHLITTQGSIFRGQVVGYFESGSPTARREVVFDRLSGQPRLVDWHDLSMLGPGFNADLLGTE